MKMNAGRLVWALVAVAFLAVDAGAAGQGDDPCAVVTDGEIAEVIGQPMAHEPSHASEATSIVLPNRTCIWQGKSSIVTVLVQTEATLKAFAADNPKAHIPVSPAERFKMVRKNVGADAVDVPGVGEEAYWNKAGKFLSLSKHGVNVDILLNRHQKWGKPEDDLPGAKAIALKVAARL